MAKTRDILLYSLLFTALAALWCWYSCPAFALTFQDDDAHIMRVALSYPWYSFLLDPFAYQELSTAHYTPWVLWSYQVDLFLGRGVNPDVFAWHQWLSLTLLIGLAGLLAKRISGGMRAAVIVILLLTVNPSLFYLLTENYSRHYVEGAVSAVLAALAVLAWVDTGKKVWWILAVLFFALSLLCKEIYLIIPALYLWLPRVELRRSCSLFIAWAAVAAVYLWLRSQMLGTSGGGMMGTDFFTLLSIVQSGVYPVLEWLVQNHLPILLAAGTAIIFLEKRFKTVFFLVLSLIVILIPAFFAPHVWRDPSSHAERILILLYLFPALFSAVILSRWPGQPVIFRAGKYGALLALFFWGISTGPANFDSVERQKKSADYLIAGEMLKKDSTYDALAAGPDFQLGELHWVIRHFQGHCPDLLLTEKEVRDQYQAGSRIGRYDKSCGCLKPVTETPGRCRHHLPDDRFRTEFAYHRHGVIEWSLTHPDLEGEAGIVFLDRHRVIPVASFSGRLVRPRPGEAYRFYFTGSEGDCWLGPVEKVENL